MLTYDTGIANNPPITAPMQQQALAGLAGQGGVLQYPGSASDVYRARAMASGVDYERAAAAANNEYLANAQRAQQSAALAGLQQMSQAQQNANSLANQQQTMRLNYLGQAAGGLNGLLANIY
jgi:hypothetical protein